MKKMNHLDLASALLDEAAQAYNCREEYKKKNGSYRAWDFPGCPPKARVIDNLKQARRMILLVMEEVRRQ